MAGADDFKDEIAALGKVLNALSELGPEGQQYVVRAASDRLGLGATLGGSPQAPGTHGGAGDGRQPPAQQPLNPSTTAKQFIDQKRPATDVERVTCLAYYLAHFRAAPYFKTAEITALNTEAAQKKLSNASDAINNAQKALMLTNAGKRGQKQITSFGEKIVDALPDREAVAAVVTAEKKHGTRRTRKPKKRKVAAAK